MVIKEVFKLFEGGELWLGDHEMCDYMSHIKEVLKCVTLLMLSTDYKGNGN